MSIMWTVCSIALAVLSDYQPPSPPSSFLAFCEGRAHDVCLLIVRGRTGLLALPPSPDAA
jgi:hypothetical protein